MTRTLQQMIHVACRELGLDQDARRDLQLAACGKASMKDMSERDLALVLDRLKADGFKVRVSEKHRKGGHARAPRADLRLVHVLWRLLGDVGKLKTPGRAGLNAFIRARFARHWGSVPADIDMLRDAGQIADVIDALRDWCLREGVDFDRGQMR